MNEQFSSEEYWSEAWIRHIESYLASPPRCGYWLASQFPKTLNVLEIAGGSCRDSRYLASLGISTIGSDFDQKTLDYLSKRYPDSPLRMQKEDGFSMSFPDKSIDLSFSNGFWVLFPDNQQIYALIHEQARVTKKILISLVHNIENTRLVAEFQRKAEFDSLYNIRFFHQEELYQIVRDSGLSFKSMKIKKFGGPVDKLLANEIKGFRNPFQDLAKLIVPTIYDYQSWLITERLACVIELM